MRELHGNIDVVQLLDPIVGNNTAEGTPANGANLDGADALELLAHIGASGDTLSTSVKIDVIIEESDDDSTYTAVTNSADVLVGSDSNASAPDSNGIIYTANSASTDELVVRCGYIGNKQYARLVLQFTGTHTNGTPIAITAIKGNLARKPA